MEISISPIINGGARKATVEAKIDRIMLKNIEIRSGKYGLFVSFPMLRTPEGWKSPIWFKNRKSEDQIKNYILLNYHKEMEIGEQNQDQRFFTHNVLIQQPFPYFCKVSKGINLTF